MFKEHSHHQQPILICSVNELPDEKRDYLYSLGMYSIRVLLVVWMKTIFVSLQPSIAAECTQRVGGVGILKQVMALIRKCEAFLTCRCALH